MIHKITKRIIEWIAETWDEFTRVVQRKLDEFFCLDLSELEKLGTLPDERLQLPTDEG